MRKTNNDKDHGVKMNAVKKEDTWVPAACDWGCVDGPCILKVHVKDGIAVGMKPNVDNEDFKTLAKNRGRLCPKPYGLIQKLYNPHRIKGPMKRTNPKKGPGIDPKWKSIGWDEALETIADKMEQIRKKDTKRVAHGFGVSAVLTAAEPWVSFFDAYGPTQHLTAGESTKCDMNEHAWGNRIHGGMQCEPDVENCNYLILFGSNTSASGGTTEGPLLADARERGMKTVVIDPVCSVTAAKADEWIPIRPGTDTAFLLAMIHIILHEMDVYDAPFLKEMTNSPYLVGSDGLFIRDKSSKKVLVWDAAEQAAKPYDDDTIKDFALEGIYEVDGIQCEPVFEVLKKHVKQYTASWASQITDVDENTIRRITREFVENAQIGSSITFDGVTLPLRPAATKFGRGLTGVMRSYQTCLANHILAALIGSIELPGGHMGGHTFKEGKQRHGMLYYQCQFDAGVIPGEDGMTYVHRRPFIWPPLTYGATETLCPYSEYFPYSADNPYTNPSSTMGNMHHLDWLNLFDPPKELPIPDPPELWIRYRLNPFVSLGEPKIVHKVISKIPFIVSFSYTEDDVTDYADILLPEQVELERYNALCKTRNACHKKYFMFAVTQPVIKPVCDTRNIGDVFILLAEKLGITKEFNKHLTFMLGLVGPYQLETDRKYTWEEIVDIQFKCFTNGAHDLEWFKKNGALVKPVSTEDQYDVHFEMKEKKLRYPLPYMEQVKRTGEELAQDLKSVGIDWWPTDEYVALPIYMPPILDEVPPEYDFYVINSRAIMYSWGANVDSPWMNELAEQVRGVPDIMMNTHMARKRKISDGEEIWIETDVGKVKRKVKLCEGIRPDCILISGMFGQRKMPIAKDTGRVSHTDLAPIRYKWTDPITGSMQGTTLKAKVYK